MPEPVQDEEIRRLQSGEGAARAAAWKTSGEFTAANCGE